MRHDLGDACAFCGRFSSGHAADCATLGGLFAPLSGPEKRDRAVGRNMEQVAGETGGDALVARAVGILRRRERFTADDVALVLDDMGVPMDLATRRRLSSVIVNVGRGRFWDAAGYVQSVDPRRNARPITAWVVRAA